MGSDIVLLTGEMEFRALKQELLATKPSLQISSAKSNEDLAKHISEGIHPNCRLIGYCTEEVVRGSILKAFCSAYNFHPGPPGFPGIYPAHFALYTGASSFGVTAHEMTEQIDAGKIVGCKEFQITHGATLQSLEIESYMQLHSLFIELAPGLAETDTPLQPLQLMWGPHRYTRSEFNTLRGLTEKQVEALPKKQRARWQRAFG